MKTPTRVGMSVVVGLALSAGLVTSVAAHPGGVAAATGSATFSDSAGDSGAAPDITSVTINGDPATRTLTVTVTAAGYLPATPDAMERDDRRLPGHRQERRHGSAVRVRVRAGGVQRLDRPVLGPGPLGRQRLEVRAPVGDDGLHPGR